MKNILFLLLVLGASCLTPKALENTGAYVISSVSKNKVTFKGIDGSYLLLNDSHKIGDTIHINVFRIKK